MGLTLVKKKKKQVFTCNLTIEAIKTGTSECKECCFYGFAGESCADWGVASHLPTCQDGYIYKFVEIEEVEE